MFAHLKMTFACTRMMTNDVGPSLCVCVCVCCSARAASVVMTAAEGYYVQVAQRMQGLY